jgi:putative ABC transport system ATP-binding protein
MLPALKESARHIPLVQIRAPLIEIRALAKSYGKGGAPEVQVLESLDLNVAPGEFLAVMGPSGSGKSTLLNIMGGIDRQTSGSVAVAGLALESMAESALTTWRSRTVGFVFQRHYLIPILTASENVELPLTLLPMTRRERRRRVAAALSLVGLSDRSKHKPSQLSGGQEQRVGIARAFVTDPPILLCDEPTGDLDRRTSDDILDLLVALKEEFGKTIILVTHDDHAATRADRVLRMSAGRLLKA